MSIKPRKIFSLVLVLSLIFQQIGFAQVANQLNIGNYLSGAGSSIVQDKFRPMELRYFSYNSLNDNFKLLLDKGDDKQTDDLKIKAQAKILLDYFLIGVTLPDNMFWVNLRPDSEDKIIDSYLGQTDIGKIMLEADVQLKKDTASFTSPQTAEGKEYWNKLYQKAQEIYGNQNVTIPTLTRPWIVPGEIIVRESKDSAYVYKATLKVMLEQDYLKDSSTYNFKDARSKLLNDYSSQLIREMIIPKLTKEVNSSKRYANLRQVYYSLVLSRWFKSRFTGKSGSYSQLINAKNLNNLISRSSWSKTSYFKQYQRSFNKGEYNVQEPVYTPRGQVIRSYFSGGMDFGNKMTMNNGISGFAGTSEAPVRGREQVELDGDANSLKISSPTVKLSAKDLTVEINFLMQMLGVKDHARIAQIFRNSIDSVVLVEELARISGKSVNEILTILDKNPSFNTAAANYRLKTNLVDPREYENKKINVTVEDSGYSVQKPAQKDLQGGTASDFLSLMRQAAGHVPFVFRDGMENFVGKFLDHVFGTGKYAGLAESDPELLGIISSIVKFLNTIDLNKVEYIFTSGIGANEMYSHELSKTLNAFFESQGMHVRWIVVNNPAHLKIIPSDANNDNSIVFEMSRSGGTKESVDFFNSTKDRFKKRIVAANVGKLKDAAIALSNKKDAKILIIDNTPGDIGGRQMNRKTLMVFVPLFVALSAGLKDTAKAEKYLASYCQSLLDANNQLNYSNGLGSPAISMAEFLFRHRLSGRNKFSVISDSSLSSTAKELFQLINEGANKNIAGGSNNNILLNYSLQDDRAVYDLVFAKSGDSQLPIFILDSANPDYNKNLEYINNLQEQKGIPCLVITVNLAKAGDIESNLKTLAKASALIQDMVVYFTYITNQDANSNPAVKFVREITAAMFEILKAKKAQGSADIRMSFSDVAAKMDEKLKANVATAKSAVDGRNAVRQDANQQALIDFKDALVSLSANLGVSESALTSALLQATSRSVLQIDIGEAGGKPSSEITEAFSRTPIMQDLGNLSPSPKIAPLDQQVVVVDTAETKISVAAEKGEKITGKNTAEKLANYLYAQYLKKHATWEQLALSCMEADLDNPLIRQISRKITEKFASLGITSPLLPLPGVAHTGIEAVMSHPESVFNIAIMDTNAFGAGLGDISIESDITIDDATYVYGIANVIRMALGGTPSIIFEIKDNKALDSVQETLDEALTLFRQKIDADLNGPNSQNRNGVVSEGALKEQADSYMYEGEPISPNELPKEIAEIYQDSDLLWCMDKNNPEGAKAIALNPKTAPAVKFGTSGDRGTFDDSDPNKRFNVQRLLRDAQGMADFYNKNHLTGAVPIGYDNRALSREYAYLTAAVLAANNIKSELTFAATPVPVVAYAVASSQATDQPYAGGIIITASHNPAEYNGIKWVLPNGGAAPAGITNQIQDGARAATQAKIMPVAKAFKDNFVTVVDFKNAYINYLISRLPKEALEKIKQWGTDPNNSVKINPMQGAGIGYLSTVMRNLGVKEVKEINATIDRLFGKVNRTPNPDSAEDFDLDIFQANKLGKRIVELLQDGDSDRFGVRDVNGERFSANELIPLIAAFLWEKGYRGKIGKTIATSNLSNAVDESHGQATLETDTGFKNLVSALESGDFLVVGEESAHVGVGLFKESQDDSAAVSLMSLWIIAEKGSLTGYQKEVEVKLGKHFKYKRIDTAYLEKAGLAAKGQQMVELIDLPEAAAVVQNSSDNETFEYEYKGNENLFSKFKIIDQKIQGLAQVNGGIAKILICYDIAAKKSSGYKIIFGNDSWCAIRVSGTGEPVIRLYVEVIASCDSGNWEDVHEQSVKTWKKTADMARDAIGLVKTTDVIGSITFISDAQGNRAVIGINGQTDSVVLADNNLSLGEFKDQVLGSLRQKYGADVNLTFALTRGDNVFYDVNKEANQVLTDDDGAAVGTTGAGTDVLSENNQKAGGIDFRGLPMSIQLMGSFKGLDFKLPRFTNAELAQINVDAELGKIRNMIQFGMLPSGQRIKELIAACQQKKEIGYRLDSLLLSLADIFKLEEENALESSPELREALVIVDAHS